MSGFAARALSGLFAVSWLVLPGFGLIDLSVTWNADWPQVLEAGWGLFATVIVAAAFVLFAVWPRTAMPTYCGDQEQQSGGLGQRTPLFSPPAPGDTSTLRRSCAPTS